MPDTSSENGHARYGEPVAWKPEKPRFSLVRFLVGWVVAAAAVAVSVWLVPGADIEATGAAFIVAALIGVLNAVLPPVLAALRLPFMLVTGFLLVLVADALVLLLAGELLPDDVHIGNFGDALLASLLIAAVTMVLQVILGTNDDDEYNVRVTRRIARRLGAHEGTDVPGIIFLEIDGLALPMLREAMRDGSAPNMARWIADDGYRLAEWETDLSSQTGASQAGILLGSNEDIPAFRWVEKENGRMLVCSSPSDCAEIERRHATGHRPAHRRRGQPRQPALGRGRGRHPHGQPHRGRAQGQPRLPRLPRQRLQRHARARAVRRGRSGSRSAPRCGPSAATCGRAGTAAASIRCMRAAMCVIVRDLIVFGVLTDMMRGRPAVYATFSSYDEVAHHSGLMRADTLEALRKLDQQFGRLAAARRYAPRPYEIVVLSDHGQTQGATFKQRNGYGLDELVERSLDRERRGRVRRRRRAGRDGGPRGRRGDRPQGEEAPEERRLRPRGRRPRLGEPRARLPHGVPAAAHARGDRRAPPRADPGAARAIRTSAGCSCARPSTARSCWGRPASATSSPGRVEGEDPLAAFSPTAATHLLRTDRFPHVADLMIGSFYDPVLDEGCAFEELISFHGGLGGPQTRPFILYPPRAPAAGRADPRGRGRARAALGLAGDAAGWGSVSGGSR